MGPGSFGDDLQTLMMPLRTFRRGLQTFTMLLEIVRHGLQALTVLPESFERGLQTFTGAFCLQFRAEKNVAYMGIRPNNSV